MEESLRNKMEERKELIGREENEQKRGEHVKWNREE
jgi:hypothetical protein